MNEPLDQLTFKLLFGLLEGSATGGLAISCLFSLGVLILISRGIAGLVKIYRVRFNQRIKRRK